MKIYNNEYWNPGINYWWNDWYIDRKRVLFIKSNYTRLVNFEKLRGVEVDARLIRHRVHMKRESLMKKSYFFERVDSVLSTVPKSHFRYCDEEPFTLTETLILAKVKPSLSSLCNIPIIYDD